MAVVNLKAWGFGTRTEPTHENELLRRAMEQAEHTQRPDRDPPTSIDALVLDYQQIMQQATRLRRERDACQGQIDEIDANLAKLDGTLKHYEMEVVQLLQRVGMMQS